VGNTRVGDVNNEAKYDVNNALSGDAWRFQLFVHILDPEDYEFVRAQGPQLERKFRRDRMRIYRQELRAIMGDSRRLYRDRAANLAAAGCWHRYPALIADTMLNFVAIGKLALAGTLFSLRLPLVIDAARNANRVLAFSASQKFSQAPQNLPA
jgi:hypothetical protein